MAQRNYFSIQEYWLSNYEQQLNARLPSHFPFVTIPSKVKLRVGQESKIIPSIRQQLFFWGDLKNAGFGEIYDSSMMDAICHFQNRNALHASGIIDRQTIQLLNRNPKEILGIVQLNLKRIRTMKKSNSELFIIINIPEFVLRYCKADTLLLSMKVIVGKYNTPTKRIQSQLTSIIFWPYWNIPNSILTKEILPSIRKDKNFLQKNQMEWHDGKLRQLPGPWNALGQIKFVFTNTYNIYIHDTPTKHLFQKHKRSFSHGCVRLENAYGLALLLMQMEKMDEKKMADLLTDYNEKKIHLNTPVEVDIVYLTATIDHRGQLMLWNDLYGKDQKEISE